MQGSNSNTHPSRSGERAPARPPITVCRIQSRVCLGGPARHTILLSSRLERERYRTVLVGGALEPGEHDLMDEARRAEVEVAVLPEMRRRVAPLADLRSLWQLVRLLRRQRPTIVHTHTSKAGALGRLAAWLARVPIVVHTYHGHVFEGYFHPWMTRLVVLVERLLARVTDAIVVLSPAQQHDICERYRIAPRERVRCIPLGLDLDPFVACATGGERGSLRHELGVAPGTILVGAVGRLVPVKNHALFLEAARSLSERLAGRHVEYVVVGDGELAPELERQAAALGIAPRVHFLGWRRDLPRIYADLDLLAVTSLNEGTPVSVIEAMAAGLPVVATAVGGVRDVLEAYPRGRAVEGHDAGELAAAMAETLETTRDAPRTPHGAEHWSAERLVRDIEALYDGLLGARSRAAADVASHAGPRGACHQPPRDGSGDPPRDARAA